MDKKRWFRRGMVLFLLSSVTLYGCAEFKPVRTEGQPSNVVEGFKGNKVEADIVAATISGGGMLGLPNRVIANMGTVGGGIDNRSGELATVGGGSDNAATGFRATIAGGGQNAADRDSATVGGGYGNTASASYATVSGGTFNAATEINATVGGGSGNIAKERHSVVGGGSDNLAGGYVSTVAGGVYNTALSTYSTVSGGIANTTKGIGATVSGGTGNLADGDDSTVSGGANNRVTDKYSAVAGGRGNVAGNSNDDPGDAMYATVGGGIDNAARGIFSVVPGGSSNVAAGNSSFAAGHGAIIHPEHSGAFLYADSKDADFHSERADEFAVRATGGFRFVTATDAPGRPSAGVRLSAGSGSWESFSDRDAKMLITSVDRGLILELLSKLPIQSWSYKTEMPPSPHLGPTAQDFHDLFGFGRDDKYISMVDADGVALAAIQGLYEFVMKKEDEIRNQQRTMGLMEAEMASLRNQVTVLEGRLIELERSQRAHRSSP